ncbi:6,7-dimethyl-8-ribityllumazine synthase [Geothrix sp. PMB-07]|uniref:6,7-dimethyl-8-ribityllumazine synthase n=1 Tax=Geothrix sp. PMB-07 TaxID=3068640 RepID=UPI002742408C|nr:6,7-dimethyl-8-ribityllumazine synthase [Geothrix sp. PMB-07]WLT32603.1 6,7-dimethyl-8-ribityllumazine synthase [Geothrix sp. PMB-07]
MGIFEGHIRVHGGDRFALVASRWNDFIVERLIDGAKDCILRHGGNEDQLDLIRVPGSFELPQAAKLAAQSGRYAGIIVLGTVIRGGTPHFDMIAAEVTKGAAQVALDTGLPLAFGVLTTDSVEQAIDRAGAKMGNKGWEAAMSVLEMVDLAHTLGNTKKGHK